MEKSRKLMMSISEIRPVYALEITMRLTLAIVINFYLSQAIFNKNLGSFLDSMFKASPLRNWNAFRADIDRLPKMQRFWPPHSHIELAAVFTVVLYVLLKYFRYPDNLLRRDVSVATSTSSSGDVDVATRLRSSFMARLLGACVTAILLFTLLLPMQRLAEMHIFVIIVNFIHLLLICLSTAFLMFFPFKMLTTKS
ncbi:hypothetical protein DICVIV_03355 [Dictyocaulus viviparus]|uniref:Uncharacterized protein n=1 Tax=Dictyocaulus viviparus TaxID=29172 RepID=A0A0D8Y1E0_DICVI|nr:hypothetical protein DICVIV_03355 [Dictyocaulus viviparus]